MMRNFLLWSLILIGVAHQATAFHIETASGPTAQNRSEIVRRHTHFIKNKMAVLAKCEEVEAECSPSSKGLRVRRELPYEEYINHLAKHFDVDPRYLTNHDKGLKSYQSAVRTLGDIVKDANLDQTAKSNAQARFDEMTRKGGVMDRFTQAVAIKRSIESNTVVSFAKEQDQFEQAGVPFNFVPDLGAQDPAAVFEPSSERVFWLAGTAVSQFEAKRLCATRGRDFKLFQQSTKIPAWLENSSLGAMLPSYPAGSRQKAFWTDDPGKINRRQGKIEKYPENVTGNVKPITQIVWYPDAIFSAATLNSGGVSTLEITVLSGNFEEKRTDAEILADASANTPKLGVLCVSSALEDDLF
jgi:hypothetical protein